MTNQEYHYYSDIAIRLFNYMNGYINKMNSRCELYIDMYDFVKNTYANIRFPKYIMLHIGTIVDSWRDEWSSVISKESYIVSVIAWALSHELHHADQLISMLNYNQNTAYRDSVEGDVERASYDWVCDHARELTKVAGYRVALNYIQSKNLPDHGNYERATIAEFYKQVILNIIIRDINLYNKLGVFTDDSLSDDIMLVFNDGVNRDYVIIKSNGKYLKENINLFSEYTYRYTGYFDLYSISASRDIDNLEDGRRIAYVEFDIVNQLIRPMIFK